jgi:hypothetical protein|tara:strand:- start:497 stop:955 length:459 start_codon:yes stop_codon:yes gene_type:complete
MAKKTISKDTPLAELTLRRYEKPTNLAGRDLIRKLCLSMGLLQPGDSRDVVVDVLSVILKSKRELGSREVEELVIESRKNHSLPVKGVASSNIRRQLKRLRDIFLIDKVANNYRMHENASLSEIFEEKIEKYYLQNIVGRVKEYVSKLDEHV